MTEPPPATEPLPPPFPSFGSYVMATSAGPLVFTAGHVPTDGTTIVTGKLGADLDAEAGYRAARLAGRSLLATLDEHLGGLHRVRQVLHVTATVNAVPTFTEHTAVADGASDAIVEALGERGRHARLAVGVASLPGDVALEVQAIVEASVDVPTDLGTEVGTGARAEAGP